MDTLGNSSVIAAVAVAFWVVVVDISPQQIAFSCHFLTTKRRIGTLILRMFLFVKNECSPKAVPNPHKAFCSIKSVVRKSCVLLDTISEVFESQVAKV